MPLSLAPILDPACGSPYPYYFESLGPIPPKDCPVKKFEPTTSVLPSSFFPSPNFTPPHIEPSLVNLTTPSAPPETKNKEPLQFNMPNNRWEFSTTFFNKGNIGGLLTKAHLLSIEDQGDDINLLATLPVYGTPNSPLFRLAYVNQPQVRGKGKILDGPFKGSTFETKHPSALQFVGSVSARGMELTSTNFGLNMKREDFITLLKSIRDKTEQGTNDIGQQPPTLGDPNDPTSWPDYLDLLDDWLREEVQDPQDFWQELQGYSDVKLGDYVAISTGETKTNVLLYEIMPVGFRVGWDRRLEEGQFFNGQFYFPVAFYAGMEGGISFFGNVPVDFPPFYLGGHVYAQTDLLGISTEKNLVFSLGCRAELYGADSPFDKEPGFYAGYNLGCQVTMARGLGIE